MSKSDKMNICTKVIQFLKRKKLRRIEKEILASVRHAFSYDDDILSGEMRSNLQNILNDIKHLPDNLSERENVLNQLMTRLENSLQRNSFSLWMKSTLDVIVVAVCVAFGIRALFLQPFQIPTGSMQPTLFGIHYIDKNEASSYQSNITKMFLPFSASNVSIISQDDNAFFSGYPHVYRKPFFKNLPLLFYNPGNFYLSATNLQLGNHIITVPGTDAYSNILRYIPVPPGENTRYRKGEILADGWLSCGDHLFVDRISIHFNPLKRGDIFIFNTENIMDMYGKSLSGYYYVKRLVGLPGDKLKIKNQILYVCPKGESTFKPINEFDERFKKIYSFQGGYAGHSPIGYLKEDTPYEIPENHYFALGDNTENSYDSRYWGAVPAQNVIGRACFVFWPISRRFGCTDNKPPIPNETKFSINSTQPTAMNLQ